MRGIDATTNPGGSTRGGRPPAAATAGRLGGTAGLPRFRNARAALAAIGGDGPPVYLYRLHALEKTVGTFSAHFPGRVIYAVKANDDPIIIGALHRYGINDFDVASIGEAAFVRTLLPDARIFYMNPVKHERAIAEAFSDHGVRDFALDAGWELEKITRATNGARDLMAWIRIAVSNAGAAIDLGKKFGAGADTAAELLARASRRFDRVGLCFHVGSQCATPAAYLQALDHVSAFLAGLDLPVAGLDIGGGFPANYVGSPALALDRFLPPIVERWAHAFDQRELSLFAEPGRALVAPAQSLGTQVLGRRGRQLYINDGLYGGLFEIHDELRFPARAFSATRALSAETVDFELWGPSCDSYDRVRLPIALPENIDRDDHIEFGHAGAYSRVFRSNFNGFQKSRAALVDDDPF